MSWITSRSRPRRACSAASASRTAERMRPSGCLMMGSCSAVGDELLATTCTSWPLGQQVAGELVGPLLRPRPAADRSGRSPVRFASAAPFPWGKPRRCATFPRHSSLARRLAVRRSPRCCVRTSTPSQPGGKRSAFVGRQPSGVMQSTICRQRSQFMRLAGPQHHHVRPERLNHRHDRLARRRRGERPALAAGVIGDHLGNAVGTRHLGRRPELLLDPCAEVCLGVAEAAVPASSGPATPTAAMMAGKPDGRMVRQPAVGTT